MDVAKVDVECGINFVMEIDESVKSIDDVMLDIMTLVNKSAELTTGFSVVYREFAGRRFFVLSQKPIDNFEDYLTAYIAMHY